MNVQSLSAKEYKNEFVNDFDGDKSGNLTPRQTPRVLYSKALPTPVRKPQLLAWSKSLAGELGIQKPTDQQDVDILSGSQVTGSMSPFAAVTLKTNLQRRRQGIDNEIIKRFIDLTTTQLSVSPS